MMPGMTLAGATPSTPQRAPQGTQSWSRGACRPSFDGGVTLVKPRGRREDRVLTSHPRSAARRCSAGKPHSSIQVVPITRPSLRSGLTAYAALSREPSSFWPPSPRDLAMQLTRLGAPHLRDRLDRSDDGQDHTVLPYARFAGSPHDLPAFVDIAGSMQARRT